MQKKLVQCFLLSISDTRLQLLLSLQHPPPKVLATMSQAMTTLTTTIVMVVEVLKAHCCQQLQQETTQMLHLKNCWKVRCLLPTQCGHVIMRPPVRTLSCCRCGCQCRFSFHLEIYNKWGQPGSIVLFIHACVRWCAQCLIFIYLLFVCFLQRLERVRDIFCLLVAMSTQWTSTCTSSSTICRLYVFLHCRKTLLI